MRALVLEKKEKLYLKRKKILFKILISSLKILLPKIKKKIKNKKTMIFKINNNNK
jgi:hypothetical protein